MWLAACWLLGATSALAGSTPTATAAAPAPAPAPVATDTSFKLRKRPRGAQRGLSLTLGGGLSEALVVEGTGEVNLPGQHSAALVLGLGAPQAAAQAFWTRLEVRAGLQYRYTVLGDYGAGLYVGAEGVAQIRPLQLGVPYDVGISPLLGFKYTAPFGLVVDVSAGPSLIVGNVRPPRAGATLNAGVGWAFGKAPK